MSDKWGKTVSPVHVSQPWLVGLLLEQGPPGLVSLSERGSTECGRMYQTLAPKAGV